MKKIKQYLTYDDDGERMSPQIAVIRYIVPKKNLYHSLSFSSKDH